MPILLSSSFCRSSSSSFFFFFLPLIFEFYFLNFFFIWRPISDSSDPMAHPQHRLSEDSSRQSDLPLLALYFSQNHVGLNEGELVLPLTRLHLHRSSQAGNEVGFPDYSTLFCKISSICLRLIFWMQLNPSKITWKIDWKIKNA